MDDTAMKVLFRKQELEARAQRKRHLMRLVTNELALDKEPLSLEDQTIHAQALRELNEANMVFYYETHRRRGYWRNLWLALWGAL